MYSADLSSIDTSRGKAQQVSAVLISSIVESSCNSGKILTHDTTVCEGSILQLTSQKSLTYKWYPSNGLDNYNIQNPILTANTTQAYYLETSNYDNLIENGNFEQGNINIQSSYLYSAIISTEGMYYITANPQNSHPGFSPCQDHTTGTGNMMVVNGALIPDITIWEKNFLVKPYTNYTFSVWITNLSHPIYDRPSLQLKINDEEIGSLFVPQPTQCTWSEASFIWNSGSNTSAYINLVNKNISYAGNDFALDDFLFGEIKKCTDTLHINVKNKYFSGLLQKQICPGESYYVGDHVYRISGTFIDTLKTVWGCDSTIMTNLTVGENKLTNQIREICNGDIFTVGTSNYTLSGTYTDLLKTSFGCDSLVQTNLTVNPVPLTNLLQNICQGEVFKVGNHNYSTSGIFTDVLKSSSGCDSIVTTNLTVNPLPVLNLGSDMIICPGDTINLTPGPGFSSYLWSDGSVLSHLLVTKPGDYSVIVRNEWCPASDEVYIGECGIELIFPNAFSPNNNATNEHFMPVVIGSLKTYLISIYNKWGQLVYESANAAEGWDGTCNGQPCPIGLYVYTASYTAGVEPAVTHATVRGSVTLLR